MSGRLTSDSSRAEYTPDGGEEPTASLAFSSAALAAASSASRLAIASRSSSMEAKKLVKLCRIDASELATEDDRSASLLRLIFDGRRRLADGGGRLLGAGVSPPGAAEAAVEAEAEAAAVLLRAAGPTRASGGAGSTMLAEG